VSNGNKDNTSNKDNESADPFSLFSLDYDPMLQKFFGKNTRPVLYALAMTILLRLGVIPVEGQEGRFFHVVNHESFMLAVAIFCSEKSKRPINAYSTYRSISRWVNMLDTRKKGRSWRFTLKTEEASRWCEVNHEIRAILNEKLSVSWTYKCNGKVSYMELNSFDFAVNVDAVAWACSL